MQQQFPEDWDDETKYPNKELIYLKSPEECVMPIILIDNNNQDNIESIYVGMIYEYWRYDNPKAGTKSGKSGFAIRRCPKCGSYHISDKSYNNLCPEALAGSAGVVYTCEDCGYFYPEDHIVS